MLINVINILKQIYVFFHQIYLFSIGCNVTSNNPDDDTSLVNCYCGICRVCLLNTQSWTWKAVEENIDLNCLPEELYSHQKPGATLKPDSILDSFFMLLSSEFWQCVSDWTNQYVFYFYKRTASIKKIL